MAEAINPKAIIPMKSRAKVVPAAAAAARALFPNPCREKLKICQGRMMKIDTRANMTIMFARAPSVSRLSDEIPSGMTTSKRVESA